MFSAELQWNPERSNFDATWFSINLKHGASTVAMREQGEYHYKYDV